MNFFEILYAQKNGAALPANFFDLLFAKSFTPAIVWGEYDGTLPATYSANGAVLADYRVYGAAEGVGDRTENLFDKTAKDTANGFINNSYLAIDGNVYSNSAYYVSEYIEIEGISSITFAFASMSGVYTCFYNSEKQITGLYDGIIIQNVPMTVTVPSSVKYMRMSVLKSSENTVCVVEGSTAPSEYVPYGYEVPMSVRSANIYDGEITQGAYSTVDGSTLPSNRYIKSSKIHLDDSEYITLSFNCPKQGAGGTAVDGFVYFWNGSSYIGYYQAATKETQTAQIPDGATDFAFAVGAGYGNVIETSDISKIMLNYGSTPLPYQPYSNTTTPIYIGSSPLGEDEYISYSEQKVYRMSGGTLTPTDPPVPLPALPTVDGTNIVDYAGQSAAPSRFYAKYQKG